jgi:hypothetical protein
MRLSLYEQLAQDRDAARRARLKAEHTQSELARLRDEHAAIPLSFAFIKLQRVLGRKYDPNQARVPAGQPGSGSGRATTLAFSAMLNQA